MNSGYTVRDYNVGDIRDAERLGRMFNTFDSVWPGGFNRGVKPTTEYLFQEMKRMKRLAICVVEHEGEMVGFCDLHAQMGETDTAYIPLLGADPAHHGKGVGRRLLIEMVRRVATLGFRELTLHTWGGNMKAVPLYKKTGFNWEPETSVFMRNFLPGLLNSEPGKAFFAGRDWYACLERDLTVAPDDVMWHGMQVFPYTFRDGDACLKATFEMASGGITALETEEYTVSCAVTAPEGGAPAGETLPITWHVAPKSGAALDLILLAEADDGLDVKIREHVRVEEPIEISRNIRVLPDAAPRHRGERERCVRSTLILNGVPIVLETGVEVVRPIVIEYAGQGLFHGHEETVSIRLGSNLDRDIRGVLSLDAHPDIAGSGVGKQFTLPARLATQCEFALTGTKPGACLSKLRFEAEGLIGSRPTAFRVFGGVSPITSIDSSYDEEIVQELPGTKITQSLRGGKLKIRNKSAVHSFDLQMPELGPPFTNMRSRKILITGRTEYIGAENSVVLSAEYPEFPGLILERRVTQMAGDLIRTDYQVINTTSTTMKLKLRFGLRQYGATQLALPTSGGVIREPRMDWDSYPAGIGDALKDGGDLAETWFAAEFDRCVTGLIWNTKAELEFGWGSGITFDLEDVLGNSSRAAPPVYVVLGTGDWETVRGWWRRLVLPSIEREKEKEAPQTRRVLRIHTEQTPLLLTADQTRTVLLIENERGQALSGELTIMADALDIHPEKFSIVGLNRENPAKRPIAVKESAGFGAGYIKASLQTVTSTQAFKLPAIRLSSTGIVRISEQENGVLHVENGVFSYKVAPSFLGSVTSIETGGVNHLHSAYPKPQPFVWANPWYGGIHPFIDGMTDDTLTREKFTGEVISAQGETGLKWSGVRVQCTPKHRDMRWLSLEADYLTLPGSDMLAMVCRWRNRTDARQTVQGGLAIWTAVGGDRSKASVHWSKDGEPRHRRRGVYGMDINVSKWAAIENAETNHRLEAVITGRDSKVSVDDMAEEGAHLALYREAILEPGQSHETLWWLVVNPAVSEFEAYWELHRVEKLP